MAVLYQCNNRCDKSSNVAAGLVVTSMIRSGRIGRTKYLNISLLYRATVRVLSKFENVVRI